MNFKANVNTDIEKSEDNRSNYKYLIDKKVKTEIQNDFILNMSLFEGAKEKFSFKVEICFGIRETAMEIWLESIELKELLDGKIDAVIDSELKAFEGFAVLEV
jgi:hypothetical protein